MKLQKSGEKLTFQIVESKDQCQMTGGGVNKNCTRNSNKMHAQIFMKIGSQFVISSLGKFWCRAERSLKDLPKIKNEKLILPHLLFTIFA